MENEEEAITLLQKLPTLLARASDEEDGKTRKAFQRLIHLSRSPVHRRLLGAHNAVPSLLSLMAHNPPSLPLLLLLLLKLLRNLCAGEPSNQLAFLHSNGVQSVAVVMHKGHKDLDFQARKSMDMGDILQVSLQLLGNACGGGEAQKEAVWEVFFPDKFKALVLITGEHKIFEPLCMVLYTCTRGGTHRLVDLCCGEGAFLLSYCLQGASLHGNPCGGAGDWIYLILSEVCSRKQLLPILFASLRGSPSSSTSGDHQPKEPPFSVQQVMLLRCLLNILAEKVQAQINTSQDSPVPIEILVHILRDASSLYEEMSSDVSREYPSTTATGSPYANLPCGVPVIDVLAYTLGIFQVLSGWEYEEQGEVGVQFRSLIVNELLHYGVIRLCLELLEGLGPPEFIYQAMQTGNFDSAVEHGAKEVSVHPTSGFNVAQAEELSKPRRTRTPYQGYRRDLVAVVGNTAYRNRAVQDEVRSLGGLSLILQQCVTDEANPFLREWGLWAVRNLVDGNMENCKEIAELQLKGSLTPLELAQKGYKVEMDPILGRPKLVNMSSLTN